MLSVIIPTWNTAQTTKKCVQSLNRYLSRSVKFETIIVDNGSTDNSSQVLPALANIIYIQNQSNLGFSKACNIGFHRSKGEYLLFLNSDMVLIDNSMSKMIKYIKSNPQVGAIGPLFLNPDLSPQPSVFPDQSLTNAIRHFWLGQDTYQKYLPPTDKPIPVENISGGAILISRENFLKAGCWDEGYPFYFEDLELCRQLQKNGLLIYFFPGSRVVHYHGLSGRTLSDQSTQWRRLIPGSIRYHGRLKHLLITIIIKTNQIYRRLKTFL